MIAAIAARAALAVAGLVALALVVRRRSKVPPSGTAISVLARSSLGPGAGLALVEAEGRRLLVAWGKDGVRLVRDLGTRSGA